MQGSLSPLVTNEIQALVHRLLYIAIDSARKDTQPERMAIDRGTEMKTKIAENGEDNQPHRIAINRERANKMAIINSTKKKRATGNDRTRYRCIKLN